MKLSKLNKSQKTNFNTLGAAFDNGQVALMMCKDKRTLEDVAVICAVQKNGEEFEFVPFAKLFNGNPYDELLSPIEIDEMEKSK